MVDRTWETRDLPVLQAISDAYEADRRLPSVGAVADVLGLGRGPAERAVKALHADELIRGLAASGLDDYELLELEPTPKGLRVVGQWPTEDGYDDLLRLIDERISSASSPDERNRWLKMREGVTAVGRSVGTGLLTAWLKGQVGLYSAVDERLSHVSRFHDAAVKDGHFIVE